MLTNKTSVTEVQEPFIPLAVLENAFRHWWVIVLCLVTGGLGGLLLYSFNPTYYEATAQFSVAIDFVNTGPLSQYEEDLAINTTGHLFGSEEVLQRVVDQANQEGIPVSLAELRKHSTYERQFSEWRLRVRHMDPDVAQRLAQIWIEQGEIVLLDGYRHAIQANRLERYIQAQEHCLEKLGANEPLSEPCNSTSFAEIQANLRDAGEALYQENLARRGLFSGVTIGPFNPPDVPPQPVTTGRGQYVFLGSLLGLIVGVVLIESGAFRPRSMKS